MSYYFSQVSLPFSHMHALTTRASPREDWSRTGAFGVSLIRSYKSGEARGGEKKPAAYILRQTLFWRDCASPTAQHVLLADVLNSCADVPLAEEDRPLARKREPSAKCGRKFPFWLLREKIQLDFFCCVNRNFVRPTKRGFCFIRTSRFLGGTLNCVTRASVRCKCICMIRKSKETFD